MSEENKTAASEDNKDVVNTLNEIFDDDPMKRAREKEIEKYEKKRRKAMEKAEKRGQKKPLSDDSDGAGEEKTGESDNQAAAQEPEKAVQSGADDGDLDEKALRRRLKAEKKAEKKAAKKAAKEQKEVNIVKDLLLLCVYILAVIAVCWAILTFVGQRTEVSGESMSNTLHSGDTLWIDKLEYEFGEPQRYDVVVFPYGDDGETFYIKRIIGMPGETVYIDEEGQIFINDELLETDVYGRETIASDKRGVAAEPITLGDDEYFVLGDNRNNSRDSRVAEVGNISRDIIIGKAVFRFSGGFGRIE